MKNQIDLRKRCAESDKICAYMKIDYRPIDDWNELMPVVQKVADDILGLHDGSYCDADTLYEHDFVNLLYKDVPYVRNIVCKTIDWLQKQKVMENITINKLELASELAHQNLVLNWSESISIYEDEESSVTVYTEEAQDIFNEYYDDYLTLIESCESSI